MTQWLSIEGLHTRLPAKTSWKRSLRSFVLSRKTCHSPRASIIAHQLDAVHAARAGHRRRGCVGARDIAFERDVRMRHVAEVIQPRCHDALAETRAECGIGHDGPMEIGEELFRP